MDVSTNIYHGALKFIMNSRNIKENPTQKYLRP
jgi:hypothetical protein